ncbi:hypothetical protein B0T16DRAFT_447918 [Cercophora newfieldiana]|uniref:Dynamin N-terminal domain-containing protein n=1 Tax=Cercophora newfieldiana TaxID=92897 RepID=A0AA40CP52_9PEZI|nr:hypothetical protein B0T16DRAFT_447918 [Cercophora newfieldiana]
MTSYHFRWQLTQQDSPVVRMQICDQARDDAAEHAGKLKALIDNALSDDATTRLLGQGEIRQLKQWSQDIDDLSSDKDAFKVYIGVQGQTGAGKSSLLNANLGWRDLLPSDSGEAATATPCVMSFNYSDDPKKLFRGTINFRKRKDVKQELEQFFDDLKERERLLHPLPGEEPMGDEERAKCLEDLAANIGEVAGKICKAWGTSTEELEMMTVDDLLNEADPVMKYIGSTKHIYASNQREFSAKVKPFLDSTCIEVAGSSDGSTREMALWPLIDSVDIFVKSPLLEGGLILVDLPGLSDVVGGRAAVARRFYEKLAVAVIVAPIIRAADEQTGANLMTENHELDMRMDGKFDGRGFCVVLSKADDIDWAGGNHKASQIGELEQVMNDRKQTRASVLNLTSQIKDATKASKKSKDKNEKATLKQQIKKWKSRKRSYLKTGKELKKKHAAVLGSCIFEVVNARNQRLVRRIGADFKRRHNNFTSRTQGASRNFKPPPIFPVSARAYWSLHGGAEKAMPGFPTAAYTGIPALNNWLRETTIPRRQRAALALLHRYLALFQSVQSWSDDQCRKHQVNASIEELETEIVEAKCRALAAKLDAFGKELVANIKKCDPFKTKVAAIEHCADVLVPMVDSWSLKWPSNNKLVTKLSHMTYTAILKRKGDDFISRSGGMKIRYNWMDQMAKQFKAEIAGMWIDALHEKIPRCEGPAREKLDKEWKIVTDSIGRALKKSFPGLSKQQDYLLRQVASLLHLKEEIKDKVGQLLADISSNSPRIHRGLQKHLQDKWQSGFNKALKERGGRGVLKRRHGVLLDHAGAHGKSNFRDAVQEMESCFKAQREALLKNLEHASAASVERFRAQLRLIINNILEAVNAEERLGMEKGTVHVENESSRATRLALQKGVRRNLIAWADAWDAARVKTDPQEDIAIPKEFKLPEGEDSDSETEDGDTGSDSDDGDADTDMGVKREAVVKTEPAGA